MAEDYIPFTDEEKVQSSSNTISSSKVPSAGINSNFGTSKSVYKQSSNAKSIDDLFNDLNDIVDDIKLNLLEEIFPKLVKATPYSTGLARKGWSIANSISGIPQLFVRYTKLPGQSSLYGEKVQYPAYQGSSPSIKPIPSGIEKSEQVVIGNSVFYIYALNQGASDQATPFYIDQIVFRAVEKAKSLNTLSELI